VSLIAVYKYVSDSGNITEESLYNTRKSVLYKQMVALFYKTEVHTESVLQNCRQYSSLAI